MFKLFQRQSWVSVVGGRVGGGGGGGVGVLANQKQWTGGAVRRGEKDFVELVASVFNGGGLSFEMGKCTGGGVALCGCTGIVLRWWLSSTHAFLLLCFGCGALVVLCSLVCVGLVNWLIVLNIREFNF